jgi:hypothetical protein
MSSSIFPFALLDGNRALNVGLVDESLAAAGFEPLAEIGGEG